jgi:tryptophan synthase
MKLLCKLATSFVYVVSRMGVTGATGTINAALPDLLQRVREYSGNVPAAVGFGVSTREHFQSVAKIADGVVVGSQIITTLSEAPAGQRAKAVEEYCAQLGGRRNVPNGGVTVQEVPALNGKELHVDSVVHGHTTEPGLADQIEALNAKGPVDPAAIPARFGEFGGQYVPESLMDCLSELEEGFNKIKDDPAFWEEYRSYYSWIGRPGHLHLAERLTEHAGGASIWLKREDLNHTGRCVLFFHIISFFFVSTAALEILSSVTVVTIIDLSTPLHCLDYRLGNLSLSGFSGS